MGTYLYCLGTTGHPGPEGIAGIDDTPVASLALEGLSVWVSAAATAPAPTLDNVRRHNDVVERACATRTALPLRFGQWFPDTAALEAELRARGEALAAALERVAGAMEMGVRVFDRDAPSAEPADRSSGKAYLEALALRGARTSAARERGRALAAEMAADLGDLVREEKVRPLGTAAGLVSIAHLVDRHDIGGYNARVRRFPERHGDLRFHFSGPWPPYGFADD